MTDANEPGLAYHTRVLNRYLASRGGSAAKPDRQRVVFVGFNKCGTKSFHGLFLKSGYLSLHSRSLWQKLVSGRSAAQIMRNNLQSGRKILSGLEHYDAYSDLTFLSDDEVIEANTYFRRVADDYPETWFVFNDRPVEKWIASRMSHVGSSRGSFVRRYAKACKVDESELAKLWRESYESHKADFLSFKSENPRSIVFNIESDPIEKLAVFLHPSFQLNTRFWLKAGSKEERAVRYGVNRSTSQ